MKVIRFASTEEEYANPVMYFDDLIHKIHVLDYL